MSFLRACGQLDGDMKEKVEAHARLMESSALRECMLQWATASAEQQERLPFPSSWS